MNGVLPIGSPLAIQLALQKRLQNLQSQVPIGPTMPGASIYPPGRFPAVMPLPPIAGMRSQRHGVALPGQMDSYRPMPRY